MAGAGQAVRHDGGPDARLAGEDRAAHAGDKGTDRAAGGRIAFKTGTSYGNRDAWSIGFDGQRTIGVWVGRPDGAPIPGMMGRSAAAPILFDAFARSGRLPAPLGEADEPSVPPARLRRS